jgi:hypothetical protein
MLIEVINYFQYEKHYLLSEELINYLQQQIELIKIFDMLVMM